MTGSGLAWLLWIAMLLVVAFLFWWFLRRGPPGSSADEGHRYEPEATVDIVTPLRVRSAIRESIASAVGSAAGGDPIDRVVWSDLGDEVLVHLDSLSVEVEEGMIVAALDLECDQTGRETLTVPFAVGSSREDGSVIAVTESVPMGHPGLASRWGQAVEAALWSGVLDYARERAEVAEGIPGRIWVEAGRIHFEASTPPRAATSARVESEASP